MTHIVDSQFFEHPLASRDSIPKQQSCMINPLQFLTARQQVGIGAIIEFISKLVVGKGVLLLPTGPPSSLSIVISVTIVIATIVTVTVTVATNIAVTATLPVRLGVLQNNGHWWLRPPLEWFTQG